MSKILIVSADFNFATLLEARLLMQDYSAAIAENGNLGFEKASDWMPELIILDAALPEMSGYQLVEKLKTSGGPLRHIPVIVVADRAPMQYLFRESDIFYFCAKPIIPAQFLKQVAAGVKHAQIPPVAQKKAPDVSRGGRSVLLAGAQEFILAKIKTFFEERNFSVEIGWDEADILRKAESLEPDYIFLQFWEELSLLNTPRITESLRKYPKLKSIPVIAFCSAGVLRDAMLLMHSTKTIPFHESKDLLEKIAQWLESGQVARDKRSSTA